MIDILESRLGSKPNIMWIFFHINIFFLSCLRYDTFLLNSKSISLSIFGTSPKEFVGSNLHSRKCLTMKNDYYEADFKKHCSFC